MKDFNIAKYLRENHLGPHAILGGYVDLHGLKEEQEMELDTEIPYEGPERKVDGFGDKYKQTNAVEEDMNDDDSENPFPSIIDSEEDMDPDTRFADLGGDQIKSAIKSLLDDGFDSREIAQFVVDTIRGFKSFKG